MVGASSPLVRALRTPPRRHDLVLSTYRNAYCVLVETFGLGETDVVVV
jgi:hypothetical protein